MKNKNKQTFTIIEFITTIVVIFILCEIIIYKFLIVENKVLAIEEINHTQTVPISNTNIITSFFSNARKTSYLSSNLKDSFLSSSIVSIGENESVVTNPQKPNKNDSNITPTPDKNNTTTPNKNEIDDNTKPPVIGETSNPNKKPIINNKPDNKPNIDNDIDITEDEKDKYIEDPIDRIFFGISGALAIGKSGTVYATNDVQLGGSGGSNGTYPYKSSHLFNEVEFENKQTIVDGGNGCYFSVVLNDNGEVFSWGYNKDGQLGLGDFETRFFPKKINFPNNAKIKKIAVGRDHTIALGLNGEVYTWGVNESGQLGTGDFVNKNTPQKINLPNNAKVKSLVANEAWSFLITEDDEIFSFGGNIAGTLGVGIYKDKIPTVEKVILPDGVKPIKLEVKEYTTTMLGSDGNMYFWGDNNSHGFWGATEVFTPILAELRNGLKVKQMSSSVFHALYITEDGMLYTMGLDLLKDIGKPENETIIYEPMKIDLPNGEKPSYVYTNGNNNYVITTNNNLYSWGENLYGGLSVGDTNPRKGIINKVSLPNGFKPTKIIVGFGNKLLSDDNGNYCADGLDIGVEYEPEYLFREIVTPKRKISNP